MNENVNGCDIPMIKIPKAQLNPDLKPLFDTMLERIYFTSTKYPFIIVNNNDDIYRLLRIENTDFNADDMANVFEYMLRNELVNFVPLTEYLNTIDIDNMWVLSTKWLLSTDIIVE